MKIGFVADNEKNVENMDWICGVIAAMPDTETVSIVKDKNNKSRYDKRQMSEIMSEVFDQLDAVVIFKSPSYVVKLISKYVKTNNNPEVISIDDEMRYVVSLLPSKNTIANKIIRITGANGILADEAVTEQQSDEALFSILQFAKDNKLIITDKDAAKLVEKRINKGKKIGFISEVGYSSIKGELKECADAKTGILITNKTDKKKFKQQLVLCPRNITVAVAIDKEITVKQFESYMKKALNRYSYNDKAVATIAAIDAENEVIAEYAKTHNVRLRKYSAKEFKRARDMFKLKKLKGDGISIMIISGPGSK